MLSCVEHEKKIITLGLDTLGRVFVISAKADKQTVTFSLLYSEGASLNDMLILIFYDKL